MATKKNSFIEVELDWAEQQLASWKAYIDANPMENLRDRIVGKAVINKEQQGKYIQETMKNYLQLLAEVDKMRKIEEEKVEIRGKGELSDQAAEFLKRRG